MVTNKECAQETDYWARWSYERLLHLRPDVSVKGLYLHDGRWLVHCPDLESHPDLADWFDSACRCATSPISLSADIPEDATHVAPRKADEKAKRVGEPITLDELKLYIDCIIDPTEPPYTLSDYERTLEVRFFGNPTDEAREQITQTIQTLQVPILDLKITGQNNPPVKKPRNRSPISLGTHRDLPGGISRRLVDLHADDDMLWGEFGAQFMAGNMEEIEPWPVGWEKRAGRCFIDGTLPGVHNLRTYITLYEEVVLALPLAQHHDQVLKELAINEQELITLAASGVVRAVLPYNIVSYKLSFVEALSEAAPESILLSRQLGLLMISSARSRNPLLYPAADGEMAYALLTSMYRASKSPDLDSFTGEWMEYVSKILGDIWFEWMHLFQTMGAAAVTQGSLPKVTGALVEKSLGKDYLLELSAAAGGIEWGSALGATVFPREFGDMSETPHSLALAGVYCGGNLRHDSSYAPAALKQGATAVLGLDNDAPIVPLARDLKSAEVARLRMALQRRIAGLEEEHAAGAIEKFNQEIAQIERRQERLRTMDVLRIGEAVASLTPGLNWMTSVTLRWMTREKETQVPQSWLADAMQSFPGIGTPEHVLVARMRHKVRKLQ